MRNINFRIWDKLTKRFIYPDTPTMAHNGEPVLSLLGNEFYSLALDGKTIAFQDRLDWGEFEVLQWSGLKDSKIKNIYEGDILRWSHDSVSHTIVTVEYLCDEDHNGFYIVYNNYRRELTGHVAIKTEVIGNIFENPDLIKP